MDLNELKGLDGVASRLKIAKEDLVKAITEENTEIKLPEHIYTKEEYDELTKNLSNEEYQKGKTASFEMTLKDLKKNANESYGIDTEGIKDFKTLIKSVVDSENEKIKSNYQGKGSELTEKLEAKDKDILELQNKMTGLKGEYEAKFLEQDNNNKQARVNNKLISVVDTIPFEIPKHIVTQGKEAEINYLKTERSNYLTLLKTSYQFDLNGDNNIITSQKGEVIKNSLRQDEKIENIAVEFARSRNFNLSDNKSLNRGSASKKYGDSFKGMKLIDFNELMTEKGHQPSSTKYVVYFGEWTKANK